MDNGKGEPFDLKLDDFGAWRERLIIYIYLTNVYGKPVNEDGFISNFENDIYSGVFKFDDKEIIEMGEVWEEIKATAKNPIVAGGMDFYLKLSGQSFKTREEIKRFIGNYKY